ncbi:neo-calmodulin-like [Ostrea edulis]|uniref:neo-calmodulin-like n=1 Tax=Ostrea edulis TaxID=37623 RepID=UPI0024AFE088|nr:neo-calmodulin-like [Ostrea edulis]
MEGRQDVLPKKRERRKASVIPFLKKPKKPRELSEEHFEEIVNSFYIIDTNQDGRLSRKELNDAAFVVGMNPTPKEIQEWWSRADMDGDGFISLEEYVKVMSTNFVSIDIEKERMKAAFSLLDRDNDGRITRSEFRAVMMYNNNEMTEKKVDELFDEVDSKRKGYLDYEDFIESHICSAIF